ncbi:hypothetical protein, partial [Rhizobium leguminosarum]|uniref:hypothetical protein n=1 Tax=Rhizobium leguminosarum TaxID=384 RepID=UPI00195399D6
KREVLLTIHWKGGQHSQLRIRKPNAGEHGQSTPEAALAVMRSMATRWSGLSQTFSERAIIP